MTRVTVTGATSIIGHFLIPTLESHNARIRAVSRAREPDPLLEPSETSVEWLNADVEHTSLGFEDDEVLIHAAPIWTLPPLLQHAHSYPKRLIAFSSTSHFTKRNSSSKSERELARRLADSEAATIQWAQDKNIGWTLFRPTLIYGAGKDQNISQIASFIDRFGFFPILGKGSGKRMPVHAADLAIACIEALRHPQTQGQAYNLPGGEIIAYRDMVQRIFHALDREPRMVSIPSGAFKWGVKLASKLPRYSELKPEMAERMNADLVFEADKAKADFGYHAREFIPARDDLFPE